MSVALMVIGSVVATLVMNWRLVRAVREAERLRAESAAVAARSYDDGFRAALSAMAGLAASGTAGSGSGEGARAAGSAR